MKYPNGIVNDDGWGRIHEGHDLNREELQRDLDLNQGPSMPGQQLKVQEVYFRWIPRVKWCANYGWPCDNEGEWHSHWEAVKPNPESAFTAATVLRNEFLCEGSDAIHDRSLGTPNSDIATPTHRSDVAYWYMEQKQLDEIAVRVIQALGLIEEWGWQLGDYSPHRYPTRQDAQERIDEMDALFRSDPDSGRFSALPRRLVRRLVSGWVRVEEQPQ